jgi:DNA-binding CsgD family transcriptional regulator
MNNLLINALLPQGGYTSPARSCLDLLERGVAKMERQQAAHKAARAAMKLASSEAPRRNPVRLSADRNDPRAPCMRAKMSPAELEHAARLFGEGHNCTRIGQQLKRSPNTIRAALERAGLWRQTQ